MDPESRLFHLHQGNQPIENYVTGFCELCHLVTFNDVALKDIFRHGLNEPIRSYLSGGKIHWSLEQYIDFALRLAGSPFTVGVAKEEHCYPPVSAKPGKFSIMSGNIQVMPEPSHAMPAKPKPSYVVTTKPQSTHVMSAKPQPALVTSAKPQPAHAMPAAPGSAHAMPATLPESAPVMAAIPKPVHKMAASSDGCHT
ncbi:hypothetical protein M9458_053090 [Cirrhinus mrigala]|uniref:Retrotransposon gag domain-containing protein n=1 Tax=Cirrhinus mrigala TaxID=683832 RepID=A0ABD0MND4_CIRMR